MKDYFKDLNPNHSLFEQLRKQNPKWWQDIKLEASEKHVYVNIRKDNTIDVYYQGGRLMELAYKKDFVAKLHKKYWADDVDDENKDYVETKPELIVENLSKIKKRIEKNYSQKSKSGMCSEKLIQSEIYMAGGYIDTEFAVNGFEGKNGSTNIRIDLIRYDSSSRITFVELKREIDNRLLNNDDSKPEIITQMNNYTEFVKQYKEQLLTYYNKVVGILFNLDLVPNELEIKDVNPFVELMIQQHPNPSKAREGRDKRIDEILKENDMVYKWRPCK